MDKIVAIQECSAGNAEVGSMWSETAIFEDDATIADVFKWAIHVAGRSGRLMLVEATKAPAKPEPEDGG